MCLVNISINPDGNISLQLASSFLKFQSTRQQYAWSYTVESVAVFHAKEIR